MWMLGPVVKTYLLTEWGGIRRSHSFRLITAPAVYQRKIVPFFQPVTESASMAGGSSNPQGSRYTHNDGAFVEYNTRLQSNNLPTFTTAASRFTEWLGSDKAYYPNARVPVRLPPRYPPRIPLIVDLHSDRLHCRGISIIRPFYSS